MMLSGAISVDGTNEVDSEERFINAVLRISLHGVRLLRYYDETGSGMGLSP